MFEGTPAPLFYLDLYNFLDGPNQTVLCLLNQAARYPGQVSNFLTVMQPQSTRRVNYRIGAPRGVNTPFYPFYATSFFDLFGGLPATHTVRTVPYRDPTSRYVPSSLT